MTAGPTEPVSWQPATIRPFTDSDSIDALTGLLHRAYSVLANQGFRYVATHQIAERTRERIGRGLCLVAVYGENLVGTVTLHFPAIERPTGCYYDRPGVARFGMFAVEPSFQRTGLGSALLERAESEARTMGAAELACDTAEQAIHLIDFYTKRGYRISDHADWRPEVNYISVILTKELRQ